MNVMAQAHSKVKALISKLSPAARYKGQYAAMLKVALIETHKEYKAMQKPEMTAEQIEVIENFKRIIASYKEVIANTSHSAYFLFHTEAKIILTENEEKTKLSWGSIHNAICLPEKRIADAYCRKYAGPIKPVHAVTYMEDAVKEMEKLI